MAQFGRRLLGFLPDRVYGDSDVLNLAEYHIDMDVAGEGLLVTYWTE